MSKKRYSSTRKTWYDLKKVDIRHVMNANHYIKNIITGTLRNEQLRVICSEVLIDCKFRNHPASLRHHHAYSGGLLVHTGEVIRFCEVMLIAECADMNSDILLGAAICHDYGKIWDYRVEEQDDHMRGMYTQHNDLIRHVTRSYAEFMKWAAEYKLDDELTEAIGHCMLAHHGRQDWGSPVEPETPEAYALHFADMMSVYASKDKMV